MSYITGSRVQSHDGKRRGTVARDAEDHSIVRVMWDDEYILRWELPECVMLQEKQPGPSARDAWITGETRLKERTRR